MIKRFLLSLPLAALLLSCGPAFAEDLSNAVPAPSAAAVAAEDAPVAPGVLSFMETLANFEVPAWAATVTEFLLGTEVVMRVYKTKRALSWLYFLGSFLGLLARISTNVGKRLDLLVQRTKDDSTTPPKS